MHGNKGTVNLQVMAAICMNEMTYKFACTARVQFAGVVIWWLCLFQVIYVMMLLLDRDDSLFPVVLYFLENN